MYYLLISAWGGRTANKKTTGLFTMTNRTLRLPLFLVSSALFAVFATAAIGLIERI